MVASSNAVRILGQVEICLCDDEHVDGKAWVTQRPASTVLQAQAAARNWLETVRQVGAPVWSAMYRLSADSPWVRVA